MDISSHGTERVRVYIYAGCKKKILQRIFHQVMIEPPVGDGG
jgi:hypothetical protein